MKAMPDKKNTIQAEQLEINIGPRERWTASAILVATIITQIRKQWRFLMSAE